MEPEAYGDNYGDDYGGSPAAAPFPRITEKPYTEFLLRCYGLLRRKPLTQGG